MRTTRVTVMCAIVVAVGATSAFGLSTKARITHSGLGPVKLGMTERQIERAGKRPIKLDYYAGVGCAQAKLAGKTYGLFTGKRLRRIYIRTRAFATKAGVRVGSSEEKVLATYPNMLVRAPQFYTPDEDNLILLNGNRKLVFSLTDGEVSEISTGRKPEIDYVEGCA